MDLIGPFSPLSEDWNRYVLTVLDSYSRYVQVVPLENKMADTVAEALVFKVLLEHGVPKVLYSNQGTEFKNQLMRRIATYFGTTQKFTLTKSPHSNNVERLHQTLGNLVRMLKSRKLKDLTEWDKLIVMTAHAINNSVCTSTGVTPNFLFLGREVRAPLDMLCPEAEAEKKDLPDMVWKMKEDYHQVQEVVREQHDRKYINLQKIYTGAEEGRFKAEDIVLFFDDRPVQGVSRKMLPRWTGPHRVMQMVNPQQYQLREERTGRLFLAHRSRIRKMTLERLAEGGRRTVLLRPGQPLDDAMDSTVMEDPVQLENRVGEARDEIPNEPRRSVAEQALEPVTEVMNGTESHLRVLDWLENALPGTAGPEIRRNEQSAPEAEAEAELRVHSVLDFVICLNVVLEIFIYQTK